MSPSILNPNAITGINYPALNHGGQWIKCVDKKMTAPEWNIREDDYICVALHGNMADGDLVTYNPEDDEIFPIMKLNIVDDGYQLSPVNDETEPVKITREELGGNQLQDLGVEKIVRVMRDL